MISFGLLLPNAEKCLSQAFLFLKNLLSLTLSFCITQSVFVTTTTRVCRTGCHRFTSRRCSALPHDADRLWLLPPLLLGDLSHHESGVWGGEDGDHKNLKPFKWVPT